MPGLGVNSARHRCDPRAPSPTALAGLMPEPTLPLLHGHRRHSSPAAGVRPQLGSLDITAVPEWLFLQSSFSEKTIQLLM